ncbi:hypothetical protein ACOMHN_051663 [Nucella lapillus]
MSVQSESVVELFGKLCDLHLGETKRSHLVQPKVERDVQFNHLRRNAFDTLFTFLKSPESKQSGVGVGGVKVELDSILQKVYELRVTRRFQDADRLEQLLEEYLARTPEEDRGALKFLAGLAGTGTPVTSLPLGHDTYNTPVISEDTNKELHLPNGPLCYGDCKQISTMAGVPLGPYMHFPPHLFGGASVNSDGFSKEPSHTDAQDDRPPPASKTSSIFTLAPGSGMASSSLFSTEKESRDDHERLTRLSLFGGLVQARDTTLAVRLDLPDLPDDPQACPPEITIPKAISMSELSEDEGFITTEGSSSATTPADSFAEEDIWELALTTTPCRNYVWERIGCEPMATERPYLTEAGPQALDELCRLRRHHEHLLDPSTSSPCLRQLSPAQLVKDIIYMLIGIPSRTFPYMKTEKKFTIDSAVSTSGLSPESLHSLLRDFTTCGTHYQRLTEFSAASELDSTYTNGLVVQAFHSAVRAVLQHYRAAILSLPSDFSLMALNRHCVKAKRQIMFLAELCQCVDDSPGPSSLTSFPLGVALISYLYQETLNAINTDNYLLMLSLLRTTCQPFVLFVQDWVFHGTYRDVYGEFMIQVHQKFLEARDESYWEKGYTLRTEDQAASVPTFLAHLALDIFRCGKALNLLRMCSPQHFLCGLSDNEIPRVSISYLRSDLRDIDVQCQMYVSRMRQVSRQLTITRAYQQQRAEEAQRELLETARRMAAMEIARLQGILDSHKQKQDAKKRKEFQRLKEQMTADLHSTALSMNPILLDQLFVVSMNPILLDQLFVVSMNPILLDQLFVVSMNPILLDQLFVVSMNPILLDQLFVVSMNPILLDQLFVVSMNPILLDQLFVVSMNPILLDQLFVVSMNPILLDQLFVVSMNPILLDQLFVVSMNPILLDQLFVVSMNPILLDQLFVVSMNPILLDQLFVVSMNPILLDQLFVVSMNPILLDQLFVVSMNPILLDQLFVVSMNPILLDQLFVVSMNPILLDQLFVVSMNPILLDQLFVVSMNPILLDQLFVVNMNPILLDQLL